MENFNDEEYKERTTISHREEEVQTELEAKIKPYIQHINNTLYIYSKALECEEDFENVSSSFKVNTNLLIKTMNDLRCLILTSRIGYPVQTATIAASLYESAYTVGYIGENEVLATKWINYSDPKNPFINAYDMAFHTFRNLGIADPDKLASIEYSLYKQLCMVKHCNPMMMKQFGYEIEGNSVIMSPGPEIGDHSLRTICFALENVVTFAMNGLAAFINGHLRDKDNTELLELIVTLKQRHIEINQLSITKWGEAPPPTTNKKVC